MKLHVQPIQPEVKKRYKMYKSKKQWIVAPILFVGTLGVMGLANPVVNAEEITTEAVKSEVVTPPDKQAQPQPPIENTKATDPAQPQAETVTNTPVENQLDAIVKERDTVSEPTKVEETVPNQTVVSKEETTSNITTETPTTETTNKTVEPKKTEEDGTVIQPNEELEKLLEEAKQAGVVVREEATQLVKDSATSKADYQKQIAAIKQAIEKSKQDQAKHEEELKKVAEQNKEIDAYNKKVAEHNKKEDERVAKEKAEAEKNKKKDGYLSEVALQKLVFESEKNSKMTVTSGNKKLTVNQVLAQAKKNTKSDYLLGKIENLANKHAAYNLKVGEKLTVEYTLNNSFYDTTKLGKVQYTYTLKQANVKSKDGLIFLLKDPTDTMYYVDYYTGSMKWNMGVVFYDVNGTQVDVSDSLVSFASLNTMKADSGGLSHEYVEKFNGQYIPINGSSVQQYGNKVYSKGANTFKNQGAKYDGTEWDYSGSPLEYYGAIAGKTGKNISFDFGSNESGYIWFAFNSKVKAPTITPPNYEKPKEKVRTPDIEKTTISYHLNKYVPTPPTKPTKTVSDVDEKKVLENLLTGVAETFSYDVTHVVGQADKEAFYDSYVMEDIIHSALSYTGVHKVLNDAGTDVTDWFTVATHDKTITFTLNKANNNGNFYGHSYTYHFGVQLSDKESFVKEFAGKVSLFNNQAIVEIDGVDYQSNVVTTKIVIPTPQNKPSKTVSDVDEKKVLENLLTGVAEKFNYEVTHVVPQADKAAYYKTYVMKDTINKYLTFDGTHTVLNNAGEDVTSWFDISTNGKNIVYTLKSVNNNADFYGHTYTYYFGVQVADKEAFVREFAGRVTQFDNKAIVEMNGTSHDSNVVTTKLVIPTPQNKPSKTVSDVDEKQVLENLLSGVTESFSYDVTHVVPQADKEAYYKTYVMKDMINKNLTFDGTYMVLNDAGKDVTSRFNISTNGKTIVYTLKAVNNNADFYGHTYTYHFGVQVADKEAFVREFAGRVTQFDNKAIVEMNGTPHDSNVVTTKLVIPTPEIDPDKTVSDIDEEKVIENLLNDVEEKFNYEVTHVVPNADKEAYYKTYVMKDTINKNLTFDGTYTVSNDEGEDVTNWFDITTDGHTILYVLKEMNNNADFYGHMYTYRFGVKVADKEAFVREFAGRVTQFDNKALVEMNGTPHDSNVVTTKLVIPTPQNEPTKTVSDSDEKEAIENLLNGVSENFHYTIKHVVPQADKEAFYKSFAIKDTVDEYLFFDGQYVVLNEAGEDVTNWFDVTTDGQTILFTLKDADNSDFYGHTYTFDFGVSIKEKEAFIKKFAGKTVQFENIAKAIIDGIEHESNAVITKVSIPEPAIPVVPSTPTAPPTPVKLVVEQPQQSLPQKTLPQTGETGPVKEMGLIGSLLSLVGLAGFMANRRKSKREL